MTLAEMLDELERGRIGHGEAMRWIGVDSYNELVENRPLQRPADAVAPPDACASGTRSLLRQSTRPRPRIPKS